MNVSQWNNLAENKFIFFINQIYKEYFDKIINQILLNYNGIPEDKESIYWFFLFHLRIIVSDFLKRNNIDDGEIDHKILGKVCKFFVSNHCKKWISKKHSIMNKAISLNEEIISINEINNETFFELNDSVNDDFEIDFTKFTELEIKIFEKYFIENKKIKQISKELNLSIYLIKKYLEQIKDKVEKNLY